jgi:hypothetical protein
VQQCTRATRLGDPGHHNPADCPDICGPAASATVRTPPTAAGARPAPSTGCRTPVSPPGGLHTPTRGRRGPGGDTGVPGGGHDPPPPSRPEPLRGVGSNGRTWGTWHTRTCDDHGAMSIGHGRWTWPGCGRRTSACPPNRTPMSAPGHRRATTTGWTRDTGGRTSTFMGGHQGGAPPRQDVNQQLSDGDIEPRQAGGASASL